MHITTYYHFKGAMWITVWELLLYWKGGQKSLQWAVVMARVSDFLALMWRMALCTKPNPFQGSMAQCSTVKLKQKGEKF